MTLVSKFKQLLILSCLGAIFSSMAYAGSSTGVTLGPPGGGPPGGGGGVTAAVPAMSTALMIAMGLLLAVIALRFLKQKGATQKVLSIAFLSGGLVLAGLGVDQATATTTASIPEVSDLCSGATELVSGGRSGQGGGQLMNGCDSATLEVKSYQLNCPPEAQLVTDAGVGAQIAPGLTVTLNQCAPT